MAERRCWLWLLVQLIQVLLFKPENINNANWLNSSLNFHLPNFSWKIWKYPKNIHFLQLQYIRCYCTMLHKIIITQHFMIQNYYFFYFWLGFIYALKASPEKRKQKTRGGDKVLWVFSAVA